MQPVNGEDDETSTSDLVEEIWIEDEQWNVEDEQWNIEDCENAADNVVFVTLKTGGKKFMASFYTYTSIEGIAKRNQQNGDYLGGKYFQDTCVILIDRCSRKDIEEVVHGILKERKCTLAPEFAKVDPWWHTRELWSTVSFEATFQLQELLSRTPLPFRRIRKRLRRRRKRRELWKKKKGSR